MTTPAEIHSSVGANLAHRQFKSTLTNIKALLVMFQANRDHMQKWFADQQAAKGPGGQEAIAFGVVTEILSPTSVRLCNIAKEEAQFVSANYTQLETQLFAKLYSDTHRTFEAYVIDLYCEVGRADKRIMRSEKTVTYEEVLGDGDVISVVLDKQREALSRADRNSVFREFAGFGLPILNPTSDPATRAFQETELPLLWEVRNILEHNHGIVDKTFLRKVPKSPFTLGTAVSVTLAMLGRGMAVANDVASDLNARALAKWPTLQRPGAA